MPCSASRELLRIREGAFLCYYAFVLAPAPKRDPLPLPLNLLRRLDPPPPQAVVPTSYSYGTYSVQLPTPLANGTTIGGGGGATLQPGGGGSGGAMSYVVDVPASLAPAPPPDGRVPVVVNVTFLPSSQIFTDFDLPATRWAATARAASVLPINTYHPTLVRFTPLHMHACYVV